MSPEKPTDTPDKKAEKPAWKEPSAQRYWSLFAKPLGSVIEPVTRPVFKAKGLAASKLVTEWHRIVGPELARRCLPQKLTFTRDKTTGGILTIAAENGFATELVYMTPIILERLSTYFGYKAVERITISHSFIPPRPEAKKFRPKTNLVAGSEKLAEEIEDPDLKTCLQNFALALTENPK